MKKYFYKLNTFLLSDNLFRWIIFFGIVLYARQYLFNRSLWLDEARISLNIIRFGIPEYLHQPLPYQNQVAPFGFCVIEKILVCLLGPKEYVLRLFPFICGVISLWLFSRIAKIYLQRGYAALAMFVFTITPSLIYFSSEVKPYYSDVMMALIAYLVIAQVCSKTLTRSRAIIVGFLGVVMIWFSFPIIFVLLGIGVALLLSAVVQKDLTKLLKLGIVISCWLAIFSLQYFILLRNAIQFAHNKIFDRILQIGYISFLAPVSWLDVFNRMLKYPLCISRYSWIAGICFLFGSYSFFREDRENFFLLIMPFLFIFLASGLHKYSCMGKAVLFLVPVFLLMIVNGIRTIALKTWVINGVLLSVVLFSWPFLSAWNGLIKPEGREEIRPVIAYIKSHKQPEDKIYPYCLSEAAFEYYAPRFDLSLQDCVTPRLTHDSFLNYYIKGISGFEIQQEKLKEDVDRLLRFKRVWLFFSHINKWPGCKQNDEDFFIDYLLESGGKILDKFEATGARGYLLGQ